MNNCWKCTWGPPFLGAAADAPPPHYGPRTNSPQRPRTRWSRRTLEAPHLQPPAFKLPSTWGTRTSRPALRTASAYPMPHD